MEIQTEIPGISFKPYSKHVNAMEIEFNNRFTDFEAIGELADIFLKPTTCDIFKQNPLFQLELCDMQSDLHLRAIAKTGVEFWKKVSSEKYPILKNEVTKLLSMFSSTYVCESAFSNMKHIKNEYRSKLTQNNLLNLLRIALSSELVDFDLLVHTAL